MERKTLIAQAQGVVYEFIHPMVITLRQRQFIAAGVNPANQTHKIRTLPKLSCS